MNEYYTRWNGHSANFATNCKCYNTNNMTKEKCLAMAALPLVCLNALAQRQEDHKRPNIIVILADDMGYSDIGCYGGEINTPNIDSLARNGLRWTQFYNNARSCPSRAVLMTGLYPHEAGMGWMAAADITSPEYQGHLNNNCVTIAEALGSQGYGTYMSGKWHLCTDRMCKGDNKTDWPLQRGFDRFYGIVEGASNYFNTIMTNDNERVRKNGDGFYITTSLADSASTFITRHDYGKEPLFLYMAFNAPHWPLHALDNDIDKYRDTYKAGWDILRKERFERQIAMGIFPDGTVMSDRDSEVPSWDSLTEEQKADFSRRMAIYAAQVDAMDQGVGKIVKALKDKGQFDNTLIMFMSDNGACAEHVSSGKTKELTGKDGSYESYRRNWANLSSTPYKEYKHYTYEGGIASPLIVSWPAGIDKKFNGSWVREYGYFADIMATCLDVAEAKYPKTFNGNDIHPLEGISLVPNFSGDNTGRGMTFWEHEVNIAARDGKWKMVVKNIEGKQWDISHPCLYDMEKDPTELNDLSSKYTERVKSMLAAWKEWAERVHAYPLDSRGYGERQGVFKRHINGGFDDNLGDWETSCAVSDAVAFGIDTDNGINGNTARIDIKATGERPADAVLKWVFPLNEPSKVNIGFTYKAEADNEIFFRLESLKHIDKKPFDKALKLSRKGGRFYFKNIDLEEKGRYQLVFYLGKARPGTIWIDDVRLDFQNKNVLK